MSKLVLAVPTALLHEIGHFEGYSLSVDRYLPRLFAGGNSTFIHRDAAEHDESYKQLIPYVVLAHGSSVFSYVRGRESREGRLVANRSIGLGGHIEPPDETLFTDPAEIYREAAKREVEEEVKVGATYEEKIVALINDDSNEVGRVHLGIVHLWTLSAPVVEKKERQITRGEFLHLDRLRELEAELEPWSRIALDVLAEGLTR